MNDFEHKKTRSAESHEITLVSDYSAEAQRKSQRVSMSTRPQLTRRRVTEETQETVQSRKVLHFN